MPWVNPVYRDPIPPSERSKFMVEEKQRAKHHNLLDENPHPQSLAFLVKLCRYYHTYNNHRYRSHHHWQRIRKMFVNKYFEEHKVFKCFNCNKTLQHLYRDKIDTYVTVDHIIPLHKGGDIKDFKNMRISCGPCNHGRQDY